MKISKIESGVYQVKDFADPGQFLAEVGAELYAHEAEYSLMLGLALGQLQSRSQEVKLLGIFQDGQPHGAGVLTHKILAISKLAGEAIPFFIQWLQTKPWKVPGVVGDLNTTQCFAEQWATLTNQGFHLVMGQRILWCQAVTSPNAIDGKLIQAQSQHTDLAAQWLYEFVCESLPHQEISLESCLTQVGRRIGNGDIFLWQLTDQSVVSMNMVGRPTQNGISISGVYTPKALRKRGYASALVAATTHRMLDRRRRFCVLYTDLTNSTSNEIYEQIGYREIARSQQFDFA